jgi:tetratricopeptide (TPR) repeat protein
LTCLLVAVTIVGARVNAYIVFVGATALMNATTPRPVQIGTPLKGGVIFICYRRSDSSGEVGRVRETFAKEFRKRGVFLDLEVGPGTDFVAAIHRALSRSSVLLVMVGPEWLRPEGVDGHIRLWDPEDYVRLEIQAAIQQELTVIPVLVRGAQMPSPDKLPEDLKSFARLQAFELSNTRWKYDMTRLVAAIRPLVDPWFIWRRVCVGLVAATVTIAGFLWTEKTIQNRRFEQGIAKATADAKAGQRDEALKVLADLREKMPEREARIHLEMAQVHMMTGDYFHQHEAAEKAIELAAGDNFVKGRARGLACDAEFKLGINDPIEDCKKAEQDSATARDPGGQVRAINFKANILAKTKKPDEAKAAYEQALAIAKDNGLAVDQYGALYNIGLILADRENKTDQEQARINFELARKGFEEAGLLGEASNVYNELGALKLDQGDSDPEHPAQNDFQKALELAVKAGDQNRGQQALLNLGLVRQQNTSLASAETELLHELEIYKQFGGGRETSDVAFVKNSLGDVYLQQGKYDDARKAYSDAERIRHKLNEAGAQAFSTACLVNVDLQQNTSSGVKPYMADLLNRINIALEQAERAGDSYARSFAHIVKARVLLVNDKSAAEREAEAALELAGDNQADNAFSAQIILAEIEAMDGHTDLARAKLETLKTSAERDQNVVQELEARLASLKLMKHTGSAQDRRKAKDMLEEFKKEADTKGYKLLASQAVVANKT